MEFFLEFALFFLKLLSVCILLLLVVVIGAASGRAKKSEKETLMIEDLNHTHEETKTRLEQEMLDKKSLKAYGKKRKQEAKREAKEKEKDAESSEEDSRLFVLDFKGDVRATSAQRLSREVSAILSLARPESDEVLIRLESPGGVVHGYGYGASQVDRLKKKKIKTTIAVDKVAASGGYMMSCVADSIVSAPFAVIGSIGVVAQIPNFNRLLKKNDIDIELLTAGEHKRTLTLFGENTPAAREKFLSELEETHALFKTFVADHRPELDMEKVATGEHWYGYKALELGLVDAIQTSDEFIGEALATKQAYRIYVETPKNLADRITATFTRVLTQLLDQLSFQTGPRS